MYGNNHNLRPPYGGVPGLPPQYPINPDLFIQNPHLLTHPFSSSSSDPQTMYFNRQNPYIRNPNFPIQQHPNTNPTTSLYRIESAVKNSHDNLLAIGDTVTAWGVSQAALIYLQVDSWASLGFQIHQIPSLKLLMKTEARVNSFIHCFVLARKFTSVYDLEIAICKNEGIEKFEGLKLGPILNHPVVLQYFYVASDVKQVHKITSETIFTNFVEFVEYCEGKRKRVKKKKFLMFLARKEDVAHSGLLGVRIPQVKVYAIYIQDASKAEGEILKSSAQAPRQKSINRNKKVEDEVSKQPAITLKKKVLDKSNTKIVFGSLDFLT